MTQEEFLKGLGLSHDDFRDLLVKLDKFLGSLNDAQREAVQRSTPTIFTAVKAFDPKLTEEQFGKVLKEILKDLQNVLMFIHKGGTLNQ